MATPGKKLSRRGARAAKRALRAAPLAEQDRPVRPGLPGGRYKPLSDVDVLKINEAVMEALSTIGLSQAVPSCVSAVTDAGGSYKEGRLYFPRALVEDTLANCARNFVLYGQDPKHDMEISGSKVHFGTAGAAVHIADIENNEYRESTLKDLYDIARIVDQMEHIHYFQRPLVARDMVDPLDLDFNTCYASVMGTTKHVGSSWVMPEHVDKSLQMLHTIAGGEKKWRERPFVSMSNCFVVPPMRFAEDSCLCMETAVRGGMPVLLLAAGQAGATSPAALAGSVVQEVAEVLAGLVWVNLIVPQHPAIYGTWPFVSDLRTGAMSGGSGEQAVLMAACGQMGRYYDLPTGIAAGMADAKMPDTQSGFEKAYTNTLAAHSGANLVYESAGMHASLLGCCFESYIIDNDMLGAINRTVRGIEVTDETLSLDAMRDVCIDGPSHYLGHEQTMQLMQKEYVYPDIGDRSSPKEWVEKGKPQLLENARKRVDEILSSHFPSHVSKESDDTIRESFNVMLPRESMTAENL
ncbi:MAG: trimethylamine methyltransferase family protein [Gammaproteobacteria bacterium]|nr:trimethylamine methyltransferase family protein [Gammaproteobacteria bacterium]